MSGASWSFSAGSRFLLWNCTCAYTPMELLWEFHGGLSGWQCVLMWSIVTTGEPPDMERYKLSAGLDMCCCSLTNESELFPSHVASRIRWLEGKRKRGSAAWKVNLNTPAHAHAPAMALFP